MATNTLTHFYQKVEQYYRTHKYFQPIPVLLGMSLLFILIYGLTLLFPPLYNLLEQNRANPLSLITSLFIHDPDYLTHLRINLMAWWLFGYIVSIQTRPLRMLLIFLLTGILSNITVQLFAEIMNSVATPIFIDWTLSSGILVGEKIRAIPSPSGGGASDGLMGLVGFAVIHGVDFFIVKLQLAYQNEKPVSAKLSYLKQSLSDYKFVLVQFIALFGLMILYAALIMDLEMFYYILTVNYAAANSVFLPFPTSRGHPLLAHIFGSLWGLFIGLYYVQFAEIQPKQ